MGMAGDFWKWFRSRHWVVQGIGVLFALLVVGIVFVAATGGGNQATTSTAPIAPTVQAPAQATAQPTAQPVLGIFDGMLVEHPASASGPDQSGAMTDIGIPNAAILQPGFQRETIDGRDVYVAAIQVNGGDYQTVYVFPLGSLNEALTVQSAYVKQFEAAPNGFTPSGPANVVAGSSTTITLQSQTYDQPVTVVATFSSSLAPNGGVIINVPGIVPNWVSSS
jgi:hypothetical protein